MSVVYNLIDILPRIVVVYVNIDVFSVYQVICISVLLKPLSLLNDCILIRPR